MNRLGEKTPELVAQSLADWYETPTGDKVLGLETMEIDDQQLEQYEIDGERVTLIEQIYDNTVTGRGISNIAIELDYAGWSLSGCKEMAERSGNVRLVSKELLHGQNIKKKVGKLEALLRDDMLRSLAYQLASLDDRELREYAEITVQHAGVYAELQDSIVGAIESETREIAFASVDGY